MVRDELEDFTWRCSRCSISSLVNAPPPCEEDSICFDRPITESSRLSPSSPPIDSELEEVPVFDASRDRAQPCSLSSVDFSNDIHFDQPHPLLEDSLAEDCLPSSLPNHEDHVITYEVIEGASQHGKPLLVDSNGYVYQAKTDKNKKTTWRSISTTRLRKLVMDFEAGLWGAVHVLFPEKTLQDCCFHWTQAVWHKVQQLGLQVAFMENGATHKRLMALPFLPHEHIPDAFNRREEKVRLTHNHW
ncbi:uncharacterized protein [Ptychodera flava]|uniref:uncharacterized protein n=1 Tax=Ptychodera flava TaxID=63121 RepID=UPI00396A73CA